jgi:hypothetical protein
MTPELAIAVAPYLAGIAAALAALRLLVKAAGERFTWRRFSELRKDERGGVQSLAFVLTTPLFVIIVMFIVQLSQLAIGRVVVEYAAFAAARSAIVWIPANLGPGGEQENRIGGRTLRDVVFEEGQWYAVYRMAPEGEKYERIRLAATMACVAASPSRRVVDPSSSSADEAARALAMMYQGLAPESARNSRIAPRLANKMAYALANTQVDIEIRHKESEPLLLRHWVSPHDEEFTSQEIGWQDQIIVTVTHDFALLPGPGRLLARRTTTADDRTAARIRRSGSAFVYPLSASARLGNEGQKPSLPYVQRWRTSPGSSP